MTAYMVVVYDGEGNGIGMLEIRQVDETNEQLYVEQEFEVWEHVKGPNNDWPRRNDPTGRIWHSWSQGWPHLTQKALSLITERFS